MGFDMKIGRVSITNGIILFQACFIGWRSHTFYFTVLGGKSTAFIA